MITQEERIRLIAGRKLRELIRSQYKSVRQFSDASGVSRGVLSDLVRGLSNTSEGNLKNIADALGMTLSQLESELGMSLITSRKINSKPYAKQGASLVRVIESEGFDDLKSFASQSAISSDVLTRLVSGAHRMSEWTAKTIASELGLTYDELVSRLEPGSVYRPGAQSVSPDEYRKRLITQSKVLNERIQELGITQAELSRRVDVDAGYVSVWIKGKRAASPVSVRALAKALRYTEKEFRSKLGLD